MASLLLFACVMSLILKMEGACFQLMSFGKRYSVQIFVPPRCCTCRYRQTMHPYVDAGFARYIHRFTLNFSSFEKCFMCPWFSSIPENIPA